MSSIDELPTISTYSGRTFNFMQTTPDMIDINDIAHALSQVCRFAGHSKTFYSVAQHSVLVSMLVEGGKGLQFSGLLHDASEAYIHDVSRPLKLFLEDYRLIENRLMRTICMKYQLIWPLPEEVKVADNLALTNEGARFMHGGEDVFGTLAAPISRVADHYLSRALPPEEAKAAFLERFEALRWRTA